MKKSFIQKGILFIFLMCSTVNVFGHRRLMDLRNLNTITISGSKSVNGNDTRTYTVNAPRTRIYAGKWRVSEGARIVRKNATSDTIRWTSPGLKFISYTATRTNRGLLKGFYPVVVNESSTPYNLPVPENLNWVQSKSYDIKGNLLSSSKGYFDELGRGTQTQSFDIKAKRIWATQTLYDYAGRPAFNTLSAPITNKNSAEVFQYKKGFIKKTDNSNFTVADFENTDIYNPATIGSQNNTLGKYYSSSNTDEEYQDKTNRPYSRTIYSKLNPGTVKQSIGGNKINGEWKQNYSFSMSAAQEMYYVYGYDYFTHSPAIAKTYTGIDQVLNDTSKQITWLKVNKSVVEDVHGNEFVSFTDDDGKHLATARSGGTKKYEVLSLIGEQKYIDIHLPKGCEGTLRFYGSTSLYRVYDLKTEQIVRNVNNLPAGFYRIQYIGNSTLSKASSLTYINKSNRVIYPVKNKSSAGVRYKVNYYDYTLNYYNRAGYLKSTLQPLGFNDNCLNALSPTVNHNKNLTTTFTQNSLGKLLETKSPDEGKTKFKYREDGQIRFSQNSKQALVGEFSYTNYDEFGRPVESGVAKGDFSSLNPNSNTIISNKKLEEKQETIYDFGGSNFAGDGLYRTLGSLYRHYKPTFLAGNVVATKNQNTTSWYSYDVYGRVKWILQKINGLGIKTIDYVYDPVTSQVLKVIYQKNTPSEKFIHRYTYNVAQELVKVETSTDDIEYISHAAYSYYETGALKRTEIANGLQGIDYIYNLAGQLKAINHPYLTAASDPGRDRNDLFGMVIDYYNGDYTRNSNFSMINSGTDQFNGNIKGITYNTNWGSVINNPAQYSYKYNTNNWLSEANFNVTDNNNSIPVNVESSNVYVSGTTTVIEASNSIILKPGFEAKIGSTFTAKITESNHIPKGDYDVSNITYDANGNIKTLNRNKNTNGRNGNLMDQFTYHYKSENSNRLDHIDDAVTTNTNADDLKDQNKGNYTYNSIGQLVEDREYVTTSRPNDILRYEYNASGLVTKITKANRPLVQFIYNDKGFRTRKISFRGYRTETTNYVRDASGSVLAIYQNNTLIELPIYGASRIGVYNKRSNTSVYQLTDHLGNVRAVVSKDNNGNAAALVSATDYYPFGMPMPGRQIVNGQPYRYAYQGQEKDPETGKEAFQLRLWDSRIGRWLTTDPYGQHSSPYMGMGNNPISRIDPDGGTDCPDPPCTGITNELPGFSLSFQGGYGLQNLDFDMNMYGRAGSMWNDIDWQEVYKPQIDEMLASISAARRPMEEAIFETAVWLAPVPKVGLLGKGFNFLNRKLATRYLSKVGQLQNFKNVNGFSIAIRKRAYKYHNSIHHASSTPWSSPTLFKTEGSAFNNLALDYNKSKNFAQLRFQTRQFGIFVNGTAKGQGMTFGSGTQSLKAYGFYTKPILSPW